MKITVTLICSPKMRNKERGLHPCRPRSRYFRQRGGRGFDFVGRATRGMTNFTRNKNKIEIYLVVCSLFRISDLRSKIGCISTKQKKLVFIWFCPRFALSLHRQNESSGYPVNIYLMPRGASLDRHYSILIVTSGWLLFFIQLFQISPNILVGSLLKCIKVEN